MAFSKPQIVKNQQKSIAKSLQFCLKWFNNLLWGYYNLTKNAVKKSDQK